MGHLNDFLARGPGRKKFEHNFSKIQIPGGFPGGMLKLRFE